MVGAVRAVLLRAAAELRPDVDEHPVGEAARLEVALEGEQAVGGQLEPVGELLRLVVVRVVHAGRRERDDAHRQAGAEHRGEAGEAARELVVGLRVRDGARVAGLVVLGREREELLAQLGRLARARPSPAPAPASPFVGSVAERADRLEHPRLDLAPDVARPEAVLVGPVDRGDRHPRGRERRLEAPVEREPLERVVRRAGSVEVAAEPAGAELLARRPDLPEVPRGEVRLVGAGVADARDHGDLALAVQLCERGERGVPAEAAVLGERQPGGRRQRQARAQLPVERVAVREEHRERVGAAVEEDRDEHLLRACGGGARRSPPRTRGGGTPSRRRRRARARPCGRGSCAGRARFRRERHPGSIAGSPRPASAAARRRRSVREKSLQQRAMSPYEVWRSGETAISWRSAFAVRTR